jgi:hypothetical protein
MSGGGQPAGRCCGTCSYYRPAAAAPNQGACGRVLRGEYWVKGQGPRPLTVTKYEVCSGWRALEGGPAPSGGGR